MEADRTRWDERHRQIGTDAGPRPPEALAAHPDLLALVPTTGRAADVACGTGGITCWLAQRGLSVVALDVSPVALDRVRSSADSKGIGPRVETRTHDLDAGLPVDLVGLDVVVCQRYRSTGLYGQLVGALAPGGLGVVTVLSSVGRQGPPGRYDAAPGELRKVMDRGDVQVLADQEGDGLASIVFRVR